MAKQLGYPCTDVIPLTQDASARKYFKLQLKTHKEGLEIAILCYLDPKVGSHKEFVRLSRYIPFGPKIYAYDLELGVTIQSYVGKYNYLDAHSGWMYDASCIHSDSSVHEEESSLFYYPKPWHLRPKQLLNDFKKIKIPNLKKITQRKLLDQMEMFQKIFLVKFLGLKKNESKQIINEIKALQKETLKELKEQEWVNCHTDFEFRNIMVDFDFDPYEPHLRLIDFQDTCIGPEGIDLAGLNVIHYKSFKFHHLSAKSDLEKVRWGGIQRNMRILGTLANLYLEQKRPFRLTDLPQILENLIYLIPKKYIKLKTFLKTDIYKDLETEVFKVIGNPLTSNQAMVLAAGYGKRMMPLTKNTPKPLLKVGDETLLDIHLNKLLDARFDNIFINVSYLGDKIKKYLKKDYANNITIIEEKKPLGTGGALINASKKHFQNDDWILVINSDIYSNLDLTYLRNSLFSCIRSPQTKQIKAFIAAVPNPPHHENGDFDVEYESRIVRIDSMEVWKEWDKHYFGKLEGTIRFEFTFSGISFIHGSVFDDFKVNIKSPFDSWSKIIKPLIQQRKVAAFCYGGKWIDVGTPNRLKLANEMLHHID